MINVAFNMETADPDDVVTLCWLSDHPQINLVSVLITPGSDDQISLVKHVLNILNKECLIGARKPHHPKKCVSDFHYNWFGNNIPNDIKCEKGSDVLAESYRRFNDLVVLSGAPLGNVYDYLVSGNKLNELIVQGGFAGDNVVPDEYRLEKFKGKITCPTFNLGGDKIAAKFITSCDLIDSQYYVSKNVCHGVCYDYNFHQELRKYKDNRRGLNEIFIGMETYLKYHPHGKLFHDPLAATAILSKNVCDFVPVNLIYNKGEWGSEVNENSNKQISIKFNKDSFEKTFFGL